MPGSGPVFPEYATAYSQNAKELRGALAESLRAVLFEIDDRLAEDPDQFPHLTITLAENLFVYRHPKPSVEITYKVDRDRKIIYVLHIVAPKLEVAKSLFISYSHEDEQWLRELKKYLKPLEQQDIIQIWDDRQIKAGAKWQEEINKSLAAAKAAVLLVSQDFLVSEFIASNELPPLLDAAKDRGLSIFWIALSASTVEDTEISKFQAVNDPAKPLDALNPSERNKELLRIYKRIKEVVAA